MEIKPRELEIPEGVQITLSDGLVSVTGPKGQLSRGFKLPMINIKVDGKTFSVGSPSHRRQQKALVGTVEAHVKNMVRGVTDGFEYKLKAVYAHFPMTIKAEGTKVTVDNFLGEKNPRIVTIPEGVEVKVSGGDITVSGTDREKVGKASALIEQSTRLSCRDRRIFQDGIYIVEKAGVKV